MEKRIETTNILEAIYPFNEYNEILEKNYWGETPEKFKKEGIVAIYGDIAEKSAKEKNILIKIEKGTHLNKEMMYIFRWTKARDGLMPAHVTMRPETTENIVKGSSRYGSEKIRQELEY